jgi:hypothetical protein
VILSAETERMQFRFRRAVFLKFSLTLWAVCLGFSSGFYAWELFGKAEAFGNKRALELEHQLRLSQSLLERDGDLVEALRHSLRKGDLDFFGWRQDGSWISFEGREPKGLAEAAERRVSRSDETVSAKISNGRTELVLGSSIGWKARLRELAGSSLLLKEVLFFSLALLVISVFFLQEIARSLRRRPDADLDWQRPMPRLEPKVLRHPSASMVEAESHIFARVEPQAAFSVNSAESAAVVAELMAAIEELARRYGGLCLERGAAGAVFRFGDPTLALCASRDCSTLGAAVFLSKGRGYPVRGVHYGAAPSTGFRRLRLLNPESGLRA